MKKLNLLRAISMLIFSVFILYGCREEIISSTKETSIPQRQKNFFASNENTHTKESLEIKIILERINKKNNFVSEISDQDGIPIWDKTYTKKSLNIQKSGKEEIIIIPLKNKDTNYLSSLLFVENYTSDNPNIYTVTNNQLFHFVNDKKLKSSFRESLLLAFFHFDNENFGNRIYYNIPDDILSDYVKNNKKNKRELKVIGKKSSSPNAKYDNVFCLIIEDCNGQCIGACDGCGLCTKSKCYDLGGGYNSGGGGGNFGNDGPYNGDINTSGGGGATTSTYINAPWYLNSGIDMTLYTEHIQKVYFTLGNFGMYLNQSQVDFLQERLDLVYYFNNYLGSAATLNEAKFTFWGINFFIQNSNTTKEQFQNWFINADGTNNLNLESWFITKSEGSDGDYIDNLDNTLAGLQYQLKQMPSYSQFINAFPKLDYPDYPGYFKQMPASQVYPLVGGNLENLYNTSGKDTGPYRNACTVRWSLAMNRMGFLIPNNSLSRQGANVNGNPRYYYLQAKTAGDYMLKTFGEVQDNYKLTGIDANDPIKVANFLKGKTGIYVIVNNDPRPRDQGGAGYTGHIDLIQNGHIPGGSNHLNVQGGIKYIRIWQFNP